MGTTPTNPRSTLAPPDTEWSFSAADGDAIIEKFGMETFAKSHAWTEVPASKVKNKNQVKLPHHKIIGGRLSIVRRGVQAALNALAGARGGVDIPQEDKEVAERHLRAHLRQFDTEENSVFGVGDKISVNGIEDATVLAFDADSITVKLSDGTVKYAAHGPKKRKPMAEHGCMEDQVEKWLETHPGMTRDDIPDEDMTEMREKCDEMEHMARSDDEKIESCVKQQKARWLEDHPGKTESDIPEDTMSSFFAQCTSAIKGE